MPLPEPRWSRFWNRALPAEYALLRKLDPLVRRVWSTVGVGNAVELVVPGRRTGVPRRVLLGLLRVDGRWFVGHPNGDVAWTHNLEAADVAELRFHGSGSVLVRARRLEPGDLRDRVILSTGQHPFPSSLVYRLARAHVRAVGTFLVLDPVDPL